jgi:hypothetical protein
MSYGIRSHRFLGLIGIALLIACALCLLSVRFSTRVAAQGLCPGCNEQAFIDACTGGGGGIDDWGERTGQCRCIDGASPIVIDSRGEGIKLTSPEDGVVFDLPGKGKPLRYSWTKPGSSNAFLVLDRDGDGRISSGLEMFGNYTPQPSSAHPNGFLALAEYDKPEHGRNGDGVIDSRDAIFGSLRLWIDANHNGISEPEELFSLPSLGVYSVSLSYSDAERRDRFRNRFQYRAKVNVGTPQRNNEAGPWAYDVFLAAVSPNTPAPTTVQLPAQDSPNTIYGSKNPEKIPTDVAYAIFLRVAACSDSATDLQKKKCGLVQRAVGLDAADQERLHAHLATFLGEVTPLDQQMRNLNHNPSADKALRDAVAEQRGQVVKARAAALRQDLSPHGSQRLDSYIESMKAKIKIVPVATAGQ